MFLATSTAAWHAGALTANYLSKTIATSTLSPAYMISNSIRMSAPTGSNDATERMVYATSPGFNVGAADRLYFDMWVYIPTSLFSSSYDDIAHLISWGSTDPLSSTSDQDLFQIDCEVRSSTNLYNMRTHTDTDSNEDAIIYFKLTKLNLSTGDYASRDLIGLKTTDTQFAGWNRFAFMYNVYNNIFSGTPTTSSPLFYDAIANQRNTRTALFNQGTGNSRVKEQFDDENRYALSINSPSYASFGTVTGWNNTDYMLMGPTQLITDYTAVESQWTEQITRHHTNSEPDYPSGPNLSATPQFYFNWAGATETARLTNKAGIWSTVLDDDATGSLTTGTF